MSVKPAYPGNGLAANGALGAAPDPARHTADGLLTLPAEWYSCPQVARAERELIFERSWQYLGPADRLAEPGQYLTSRLGYAPIVLVRGQDGTLRGFVNVCRHRAHLVAEGCGRRETLQCPYHAWTYDLDGSLRAAPRSDREPGFDRSEWGLRPIAVESFGPLVFGNLDVDAAPLRDALGPVASHLGEIALERLRFHSREEWSADVNWKVAIENYLECYHCPVAHPGFSEVIDTSMERYELSCDGLTATQTAPVRQAALDGRGPYDARGEIERAQYHYLFPATTVNVSPGPLNLNIDSYAPDGPGRVRTFTDFFYGDDVAPEAIAALIAFSRQVGAEDLGLITSVQQGLASGTVPYGRLLPLSERLIGHFGSLVRSALAEGAAVGAP